MLAGPRAWQQEYAAQYDTHRRLAEALGLTADAAEALPCSTRRCSMRRRWSTARVSSAVRTNVLQMLGRMPEALACGREAARSSASTCPRSGSRCARCYSARSSTIRERTAAIGIDKLLDLPLMQDPGTITLCALLMPLPAGRVPERSGLVRAADLHDGSGVARARQLLAVGARVRLVRRLIVSACWLVRRGLSLREARRRPRAQAQRHVDPVRRVLPLGDVRVALETADRREHRAVSAEHPIRPAERRPPARRLQRRAPLLASAVPRHAARRAARRRQGRRSSCCSESTTRPTRSSSRPRMRLIDWLRGERRHGDTLGTDDHDETACTAIIQARGNRSFEYDWFLQLAMQRYYCGDFAGRYDFAQIAEESRCRSRAGFVTRGRAGDLPLARDHGALRRTRTPRSARQYDAELARNRELLARNGRRAARRTTGTCICSSKPSARASRGARIEAADLYDRAIAARARAGFVNIEALACRARRALLVRRRQARLRQGLSREGAARLRHLGRAAARRPISRPSTGVSAPRSAHGVGDGGLDDGRHRGERSDALDLATVLKASQAIAGEIVLERLLATLLDIIVENAGAESAVLVARVRRRVPGPRREDRGRARRA